MPHLSERAAVPAGAATDIAPSEADIASMAEATIARGSQSFAAAAKLFDPVTRQGAMLLYAWCRHCDDVVDDQDLGFQRDHAADTSPQERIAGLEALTRSAFAGEAVVDPAFQALQIVVRRHGIPLGMALDHLDGFRMDVDERHYQTVEDLLDYCHHVAGVVGEMMSMVMGVRDAATLQRAADLGLAFQLTNIARDIVPDARVGRVYLPAEWLDDLGMDAADIVTPECRPEVALLAARLVALAEPYYASARIGVDALPRRSAWAVATALGVYREIGLRVVSLGHRAWDGRVSTSKADKLGHVARAALIAFGPRRGRKPARAIGLWQHAD
jgi:phytoene synthase